VSVGDDEAASGGPDWWPVVGVADVLRELEEAATAEEWNGTLARFMHTMLTIFMAQHPEHDSARDAVGEKLLRLIERGFVPPPHRARKLRRARLDAAICAGCRTQAEAVALLIRLSPMPGYDARGRGDRKLTESEARSRVRAAKQVGLALASAPRGGNQRSKDRGV
jgi:hypothetical protein